MEFYSTSERMLPPPQYLKLYGLGQGLSQDWELNLAILPKLGGRNLLPGPPLLTQGLSCEMMENGTHVLRRGMRPACSQTEFSNNKSVQRPRRTSFLNRLCGCTFKVLLPLPDVPAVTCYPPHVSSCLPSLLIIHPPTDRLGQARLL